MSKVIPPPPCGEAPATIPPCPIPLPPGSANVQPLHIRLLHEAALPAAQALPAGESRDAKGRFAPGNPGKPPGTRNKITVAIESLLEGQWETLTKTALQMALRGDVTALRLCFDRLAPVRRGSSVTIPDFPTIATPADVPRAQAALLAAVVAGHVTADEAKPLSDMIAAFVSALDVTVLAERLDALEKQIEETRDHKGRGRAPV